MGVAIVIPCSSKDGLVKLWDLHTQHCFQTLVSHHREVWSFEIVGGACDDMVRLVVASGDPELKVYHISHDKTQQPNVCSCMCVCVVCVFVYLYAICMSSHVSTCVSSHGVHVHMQCVITCMPCHMSHGVHAHACIATCMSSHVHACSYLLLLWRWALSRIPALVVT